MQRTILKLHSGFARLFLAGLLLQFYLSGTAMFGVGSFGPHRMLGSALTVLAIVFPALALLGRLGRPLLGLSLLLLALAIVQLLLPALRGSVAWVAALHPVNALALMGLSAAIGRSGRAEMLRAS